MNHGAVLEAYKRSPEYRQLAPATQAKYARSFDLLKAFHDVDITKIKRRQILEMRDALYDTPAAANALLFGWSAFLSWAVDREYLEVNPCARIKRLKIGEYRRWPEAAVAFALVHFREPVRRAVYLALYTGQREGDVVRMTWADYSGTTIRVRQEKTGAELWIPVHEALKAELDSWPKISTHILTNDRDKPWSSANSFAAAFGAERDKSQDLAGLVFHGLRKTAAALLAEAGVPAHHIMAVTGHRSVGMLAHYTREAAQLQMAQSAISTWEKTGTLGEHSSKIVKIRTNK